MKKPFIYSLLILSFLFVEAQNQNPVIINVDVTKTKGEMKPIWAMFGYDEPNFTYMNDGKKLLSELSALSPTPVYVRCHHLMTSGDGTPALKWGSTNMYSEDSLGHPVYNWTIVDKIFDTFVERKIRPIAQIGFMPEDLSPFPNPYKGNRGDANTKANNGKGFKYPPKDYDKWSELIYQWVKHCVDRYGKEVVETWYWELWNEPDSKFYLIADDNTKAYCKMYDYASIAIKRALPTAKIGGPHITGGGKNLMMGFLEHVYHEPNIATGKKGIPLDYVGFHAKGSPKMVGEMVQMGMASQLRGVTRNFEAIASFPEVSNLPVIIGECDPEPCAACGIEDKPANTYRNGTLYSSYTAASFARLYDIADEQKINLIGAVSWSFEFENQPWFHGYRDLATNGVDKPVLNVFRMFGMMTGNRVEVSGNLAYDYKSIRESGVQGEKTDINAIAATAKNIITVMVWDYHDNDIKDAGSPVELKISGIPAKKARLNKYTIDQEHSNSFEVWKKMGSPKSPTAEQFAILENAGKLERVSSEMIPINKGKASIKMQLTRQEVSLFKITYDENK